MVWQTSSAFLGTENNRMKTAYFLLIKFIMKIVLSFTSQSVIFVHVTWRFHGNGVKNDCNVWYGLKRDSKRCESIPGPNEPMPPNCLFWCGGDYHESKVRPYSSSLFTQAKYNYIYHAIENRTNQNTGKRCIFDCVTFNLPIMRHAYATLIVLATTFSMVLYKIVMPRSLVVYHWLLLWLVFSWYTYWPEGLCVYRENASDS